jgi:hypothetical protein
MSLGALVAQGPHLLSVSTLFLPVGTPDVVCLPPAIPYLFGSPGVPQSHCLLQCISSLT